ncbi:MAG TPA: hypothetical protein VJ650_18245 [Gemmatimonadaceae bacterium]|nr:hypothetical protein [Gemmatimonadaceae bacterium]
MSVRIIGVGALAFVSAASVCSTGAAIAVAPLPDANFDSAARTAYALVERVTARRGLEPWDLGQAAVGTGRDLTCFSKRSLLVCGEVNAPEIHFTISEVKTIGFTPWADSVRTELLDSLRVEFGAVRVRECEWKRMEGSQCLPARPARQRPRRV